MCEYYQDDGAELASSSFLEEVQRLEAAYREDPRAALIKLFELVRGQAGTSNILHVVKTTILALKIVGCLFPRDLYGSLYPPYEGTLPPLPHALGTALDHLNCPSSEFTVADAVELLDSVVRAGGSLGPTLESS